MSGILTINIAAPGTEEINPDTGVAQSSLPGHIWFTVTDSSGQSHSFGFDPIAQGSPFGAGQVVSDDSSVYQGRFFTQSAPLTDAQVAALIAYGQNTQNEALLNAGNSGITLNPSIPTINTEYNVLGGAFGIQGVFGNNCPTSTEP